MAAPIGTATPEFDLLDTGFYLDDPHAAFAWMRAHAPVYRDQRNGLWAVTRHADIKEVERRSDEFVSGHGYRSFHAEGENNMIALDDPEHADQRTLVSRRFTPRAVREHGDWIRTTVRSLIAAFPAGQVEVVDAIAAQLPCRLTARLLGWPEDRWPDIKRWSERLMRYDAINDDTTAFVEMMEAINEFNAELPSMAADRRGCPVTDSSDLLSVWANATLAGRPMEPERIMHETGLFISGGAETTRTVIARGLRELCGHPEQWEAMATEPALIHDAVEELVRWVTPLNNFFRTATTDTEIGDQPIATGDRVILVYPSGNRDEAVFDAPFEFDITRTPNPHLGFGFGTHFCLGASLARLELAIVFEELTSAITDLHVVQDTDDEPNIFASAVRSFTLGFDRRP
jgi:cholest-4-en-3-one 26-monooxygenase